MGAVVAPVLPVTGAVVAPLIGAVVALGAVVAPVMGAVVAPIWTVRRASIRKPLGSRPMARRLVMSDRLPSVAIVSITLRLLDPVAATRSLRLTLQVHSGAFARLASSISTRSSVSESERASVAIASRRSRIASDNTYYVNCDSLRNPRVKGHPWSGVVQRVASGLCFGFGFGVLFGARKFLHE